MRQHLMGKLWGHRDFIKLWVGKTVSDFGNGITGIALPLTAILLLSATPAQMGILSALSGASVLLFGLFAGVWVDRLPRRPILIITDLGRALLLGSIPLAAVLGVLRIGQLYIVAGLVGVLTVFFTIADQSFLPSLIPPQDLVEGNSKLGASSSIAEIGGPAFAGPLIQLVGSPLAIAFDAVSFVCSALCVGSIRTVEPPPPSKEQRRSTGREIVEGIRIVLYSPLLRTLAISASVFEFFGNFIGTLYILYIVRVLSAAPILVGFVIATGGVSALVGAFVAERVVRRFKLGRAIGGALLAYGITGLFIPLAQGPMIIAVSFLFAAQLGDILVEIYLIGELSLRQALIPQTLLGRANASMQVLTRGVAPIGALVAGVLGGLIGIRLTILIGVLGVIAAGLGLLCSPVRKVDAAAQPLLENS